MNIKPFRIKCVLFDFDGTLTIPGAIDFNGIKEALKCDKKTPILEFIEAIKDKEAQKKAAYTLEQFEIEGANASLPNIGAPYTVKNIKAAGIKTGIITRNSLSSVKRAMDNFKGLTLQDFDIVITRDTPVKPKPAPDPIYFAAEKLVVDTSNIMIVGDFEFDITAGKKAGALTFLVGSSEPRWGCDFYAENLSDVEKVVRLGKGLRQGKLPGDMLNMLLSLLEFDDKSVIIKARAGEDTAAVDIEKEEVLILTSDPITFAAESMGIYTVIVNANDIAVSGAIPRWLIATMLFPVGTTASEIFSTLAELKDTCKKADITLCGGHTEITGAVKRPVIVGTMAGTVIRDRLIDKRNMKPKDLIVLTKGAAIEGTAIIASKFEERLKRLNITDKKIERAKKFIEDISIVKEAEIAAKYKQVTAMHDVTEGGLATAVKEISMAGSLAVKIDIDKIEIFPETREICRAMNINPLGLIGSGGLLICCGQPEASCLIEELGKAGINAHCIGEVLEDKNPGSVSAFSMGKQVDWPDFEVDEIASLA